MTQVLALLLALLIGVIAVLRAMTAPADVGETPAGPPPLLAGSFAGLRSAW